MTKKTALAVGAMLLLGVNAPALAQKKPAPKAPAAQGALTQEQKDHGVETFRLIASAMQSQNVPDDVKSVLMGCIYENPIGKISEATDKVIAANPGKVDRTKPEQMLSVIAQICGYEPPKDAATPAPAPAQGPPAPSGTAKGR